MRSSKEEQRIVKRMHESGIVVTGPANLFDFLLVHDGSNDPTFTIYDDTSAVADNRVFSGTWTDAARPLGWVNARWRFVNGIYIAISNMGTGWFVFGYNQLYVLTGGA